jgi:predicted CXXCH cytochrome family protein
MLRLAALIPAAMALLAAPAAAAPPTARNTCVDCHGDLLEEKGTDVHRTAGLTCVDCHRGDPSAEDQDKAMSPAKGFVGKPRGWAAARMCGTCHSDIERMRVINPRLPTDQLAQYRTSEHGKLALGGSVRVATCVSCHGFHGIRPVSDPGSPASKGRIVETCTGCHNPEYMKGVEIPADQRERYERSVHGRKRLEERDLSAPACSDCHGNHGAAPPGVYAVTHVCGKCHVTQAELFGGSSHATYFRDAGVPPCTTCHDHHEILPTSDEMLGTGPRGVCAKCHEPGDRCDQATLAMKNGLASLAAATERAKTAIGRAERLGMDVERPTYDLSGASEALVRARVVVHTFSEKEFGKVVAEGNEVANEVDKAAEAKLQEHRYRREGLAIASAMLLLFAGLLAWKARRLDRERPPGES